MKNSAYAFFCVGVVVAVMVAPRALFAAMPGIAWYGATLKLPYQAGESFVVTQGYDSPPTHIKKDLYATDWSQNGCEAYGKPVVAALAGKVILAETADRDTGYGLQVLVDHGGNHVTRYAHLERDSIAVAAGDAVPQGAMVGRVGDTGYVVGAACPDHYGTHLHFALYNLGPDGEYDAVKPEPISGYTDIMEGKWYLSDNEIDVAPPQMAQGAADSDGTASVNEGQSAASSEAAPETFGVATPQMAQGVVAGASTSAAPFAPMAAVSESSSSASSSVGSMAGATIATTLLSGGSSPVGGGITSYQTVGGVAALPGDSGAVPAADSTSSLSFGNNTASSSSDFSSASSTMDVASSTPSAASSTASSTPCADWCGAVSSTTPSSTATSLFALDPPSPPANATSIAAFNSSTFALDLAWQVPANASGIIKYAVFDLGAASSVVPYQTVPGVASGSVPLWTGTSTTFSYPSSPDGTEHHFGVQATDEAGNMSTVAFASAGTPDWLSVVQPYDGDSSYPSWYSDTWYNLGTGFYGTIRSLMLNGSVDNPDYFATHVWLDEFLDANYTVRNQTFSISDNAPFTATSTLATIGGLNIPLQPNKYYRLDTYQDYQNRSVVLRGTTATGTAMSNGWINGVGRVENYYPFYPYLAWTFVPNWPPLLPPNPPPALGFSFNTANLTLGFSWGTATDPDTTSTLLTYQVNISTSTSFDDTAWRSVGKNFSAQWPLAFPNVYHVGVRAVDDLGNISTPAVMDWNFPAGYFPLPSQLGHDGGVDTPTKFHLAGPISLDAIALWTGPGGGPYRGSGSYVELHADAGGAPGALIAATNGNFTDNPASEAWHQFSTPVALSAGDYWIEGFGGGCSSPVNVPSFYGSNGQMYFRLQATY
jgi:murein DD-endopeptidase MepM/ murein hydrolase activator NlpD